MATVKDFHLLRATHQFWKLQLFLNWLFLGITIFALSFLSTFKQHQLALTLLYLAVTGSGIAFAIISIRCPKCRIRWVWWAASNVKNGRWFTWLKNETQCPGCTARRAA